MNSRGQQKTCKWWNPKNELQKDLFEEAKEDIKTFLTVTNTLPATKSYAILSEHLDGSIKFREMGFENFGAFLFHCDDVINVTTDVSNNYYLSLRGPVDEEAAHIKNLVENQKGTKQPRTFPVPSDVLLSIQFHTNNNSSAGNNSKQRSPSMMFPIQQKPPIYTGLPMAPPPFLFPTPTVYPSSMPYLGMPNNQISFSNGGYRNNQKKQNAKVDKPVESKKVDSSMPKPSVTEKAPINRQKDKYKGYTAPSEMTKSNKSDTDRLSSGPSSESQKLTTANKALNNTRYSGGGRIVVNNQNGREQNETVKFDGRLLGADEYGYVFVQINDPGNTDAFDQLNKSLRDVYSPADAQQAYRINREELKIGLSVVVHVDRAFVRCKIFEINNDFDFCICHQIDYGTFTLVKCKDIYRIQDGLKSLFPRVYMCMISGTDQCMLSDEVGRAMANAEMFPDVLVTVISKEHPLFKVPVVTLHTRRSNHNLLYLMRRYGKLPLDCSMPNADSLTVPQQSVMEFLERRCYF